MIVSDLSSLLGVTVIVPTRNESGSIISLINRLLELNPYEIIVVDDSDDNTPLLIESVKDERVSMIHREKRYRSGGLGGAVSRGIDVVSSEWFAVIDGDLQHPPEVLVALYDKANKNNADGAIASRFITGGSYNGANVRQYISVIANTVCRRMLPARVMRITDPMSGCFILRRDRVNTKLIRPNGFKILLEIIVQSSVQLRLVEVPYTIEKRKNGESKAGIIEAYRLIKLIMRLRRKKI